MAHWLLSNMATALELLQAKLRTKPFPLEAFLVLSCKVPAYDWAGQVRLLASWLGPFEKPPKQVKPEPENFWILRSWKTLCLAEACFITEEQVIALLLSQKNSP